jgi:hypothetical protein
MIVLQVKQSGSMGLWGQLWSQGGRLLVLGVFGGVLLAAARRGGSSR